MKKFLCLVLSIIMVFSLTCLVGCSDKKLALRETRPDITVEAALPCPTQADTWPAAQRARYAQLVAACDFETMVSEKYSSSCMQRRHPLYGGIRADTGAGYRGYPYSDRSMRSGLFGPLLMLAEGAQPEIAKVP